MFALVSTGTKSGTYTAGSAVSLATPSATFGSTITETSSTVLTITAAGIYRLTYFLPTSVLSLLGGISIELNGNGVGPTTTLALAGQELSGAVDFAVSTADLGASGASVSLVVAGLALTFPQSGAVSIEQIT